MTASSAPISDSGCCLWNIKNSICSKDSKVAVLITLLVVSLITLTISVFIVMISTGVLGNLYPVYAFETLAQVGSGMLVASATLTSLTALGLLIDKVCESPPVPPPQREEDYRFLL